MLFVSWKLSYETLGLQAKGTIPFKNGYAGAFANSFQNYQNPPLQFHDQVVVNNDSSYVIRKSTRLEARLEPFTLDAKQVYEHFTPLWLTALAFLLIGFVSLMFGTSSQSMFSFYAFCSLGSSYLAGLYDFHTTYQLCNMTTFCFGFIPAVILHLAIEFPYPLLEKNKTRWICGVYATVSIFAFFYMWSFAYSTYLWPFAEMALGLLLWLSFLVWIVMTRIKWNRSLDLSIKRQCKWIFNSAILSFGIITSLWVISLGFDLRIDTIRLVPLMLLFPATIVFSMMQFNLFIVEKLNVQVELAKEALTKTQSELAHSQRLSSIGTLAGGTAHEIGNAMNLVLGNLPILKKYILTLMSPQDHGANELRRVSEDLPLLISDIDQGAQRAYRIAEDLKSFSKQTITKSSYTYQSISIESLLKEAAHASKPVLKNNQHIVIECENTNIQLMLPKDQMLQVILNLILNARDASNESASIQLGAKEDHRGVYIYVRDQGHGIHPDHIHHVFDPFFSTKEKGTGLGLSVCYGMIQDMGGTLSIESEPNQGTLLTIYFDKNRKA